MSIKFKLADEIVPVFSISLAKFVTSIVTVSVLLIVALLLKSSPAVILRLSVLMIPALLKSAPAVILRLSVLMLPVLLKSAPVSIFRTAVSKPLPAISILAAAIEPNVFVSAL